MPKLTIYLDNKSDIINGLEVGHNFIKLEGDGLNQGVFSAYNPDGDNDLIIGFHPENVNQMLNSPGELKNEENRLNLPGNDPIQKEIELTETQYNNIKSALEAKINNLENYQLKTHNCVDFIIDLYRASGLGNNFFSEILEFSDQNLINLGGAAANYALNTYGGGNKTLINLGDKLDWYLTSVQASLESIVDYSGNATVKLNSMYDGEGNRYVFVENGGDTINLRDELSNWNNYKITFGTPSSESFLLSGDKYIVDGGDGIDTISYASSGSAVNVDLDAGNTLQSGIIGFKDIFDNIEAVTGRIPYANQHIRNISLNAL